MARAAAATRSFYGRWARVYDLLATRTPGVERLRQRAVASLELEPGDAVLDVGCGTGATLPYLREAVGPEGRVVGVDLTPELLARARERTRQWENVDVVCGDATALPLTESVDGVLASFVVGMLPDPATAVDGWLDVLAAGGRAVILDAATSSRTAAAPLNPLFRAFVRAGAPQGAGERTGDPSAVLDRRVDAAHGALVERTDGDASEHALGFVRLTAGGL